MDTSPVVVGLVLALLLGASGVPLAQAAPGNETTDGTTTGNTTTTSSVAETLATASDDEWNTTTNSPVSAPPERPRNASGPCAGMGSVERAVCTGIHKGFGTVIGGFIDRLADSVLTRLQNGAETFVEILVSRPVPLRNGEMELVQRPTNSPMGAVYDLWLAVGLPAAITVWAFMMLIMRFTAFLPSRMAPAMQSRKKMLEGWFTLFRILASWIWCALILHLTLGIAVTFAPSGEQIITGFEALAEAAVGAGITALVLYLSSGVLFVLVLIVFGLSFLAPFVLMPAYPLFIAISMPDFWIFKWFAQKGEFLRSLFAPAAFMPVPTAIILGAGYPVLNAIRGSLSGPIASIAGIPTYIILLLVMWFTALIAPLFLFLGTRKMRPLTMFAAGALGAATAMNVSRGAKGLRGRLQRPSIGGSSSSGAVRNTGVGRTVNPLEGSPFSRDSAGGFGGELGDTTSSAGALGAGGAATNGQSGAPVFTGENSHEAGSRADQGLGNVPNEQEVVHVSDWAELDKTQEYAAGFYGRNGDLQRTDNNNPSSVEWLERSAYDRMSEAKSEETIILRGEEDGRVYDVRDAGGDRMSPEEQHRDSSRVVEETRKS